MKEPHNPRQGKHKDRYRTRFVNAEQTKARNAYSYEERVAFAATAQVAVTDDLVVATDRVADATETMAMVEYLKILGDLLDRGLVSEERVLGLEKKLAERFEGVLGE